MNFNQFVKRNNRRKCILGLMVVILVGITGMTFINANNFISEIDQEVNKKINEEQATEQNKMDTLYGIGSVSKMYTTVAIMQLVDEGKVALDTPIITYIPEFEMLDDRYKAITVRMLLNHSSGLMGSTYSNTILYADSDTKAHDTLLENLKKQRLKTTPGQYSTYCNDGFVLAEIIVERVSGESFTDYLQHHIFEPLMLKQSGTHINKMNDENQAKTYFDASTLVEPEYAVVIGTGGILSTAEEVCRFGSSFIQGQNNLLSEKAIEEMSRPVSSTSSNGYFEEGSMENYGLGWDSINAYPFKGYGIKALMKAGDLINQHAALVVLPEQDISISVLSSGGGGVLNTLLAEEIAKIALEESGIEELINISVQEASAEKTGRTEPKIIDKIPNEYLSYEGSYANNGGIYHLSFEEDKLLKLESCDTDIIKVQFYHYTDEDVFISEDTQYIDEQGMKSPTSLKSGKTRLSLRTEKDGKKYIYIESDLSYAELGECQLNGMFAERLEDNTYKVSKTWTKRDGKKYYLTSEKYSSMFWTTYPTVKLSLSTEKEGYINAFGRMTTAKITGENEAKSFVTLSGGMGRDLNDVSILQEGTHEILYLEDSNLYYIEESAIPNLELSHMPMKVETEGTRWYTFDEQTAGQTIGINVTGEVAVYIYNKDDVCIYNSYMKNRSNKVILPKEGKMVVINGEKGSVVLEKV